MKKNLLALSLLATLTIGCGSKPVLSLTTSSSTSLVTSEILTLEDFDEKYLRSAAFLNQAKDYKYESNVVINKVFIELPDSNIESMVDFGPSEMSFITNNGDIYLETENKGIMSDGLSSYRFRNEQITCSDRENRTIYQEFYQYLEKSEDLINFEPEYLNESFTSLTKSIFEESKKDNFEFEISHYGYLSSSYNMFRLEEYSDVNIVKRGNEISFSLSLVDSEGAKQSFEGKIDVTTFDIEYTYEDYLEGTRHIKETNKLTHGNHEINYDTNKNYREVVYK